MKEPKKEKKKRTAGDVIRGIIMAVALCVFCYSGYQLITIYLEYQKGTDEYTALEAYAGGDEDPDQAEAAITQEEQEVAYEKGQISAMENPVDFDSLKSINEEIVGWIKIKALDISYPVTQGTDNEYYLHNTFEKNSNFAGSIFMDYRNKKDLTDQNTLIYGHNMKNGSMFGKLKQFYEEGVYESSPYFWIYTPEKIYKYEIFSCYEVGATSKTYQLDFTDDEDFLAYLNNAKEQSVVENTVEVGKKDKVVTLSTCTGNDETRFIVQGKLVKTYETK